MYSDLFYRTLPRLDRIISEEEQAHYPYNDC